MIMRRGGLLMLVGDGKGGECLTLCAEGGLCYEGSQYVVDREDAVTSTSSADGSLELQKAVI